MRFIHWVDNMIKGETPGIRKFSGIILLLSGITYIFIYTRIIYIRDIDGLLTDIKLSSCDYSIATLILTSAAILLGVGNITDIWKNKNITKG